MATAKAGDKISERALSKADGIVSQTTVSPKAPGDRGQWFCIDCGESPQNNLMANSHESHRPSHRLAWRNFATDAVEEA